MQKELETIDQLQRNVGELVWKKSKNPFKSGRQINTVKGVIEHPITKRPAYTFREDGTYVEALKCQLVPESYISNISDFNLLCKNLEYDATYDKVGSVYYKTKNLVNNFKAGKIVSPEQFKEVQDLINEYALKSGAVHWFKFEYGMKVLFPAHPISMFIPQMGIAMTSVGKNDKPIMAEFTIEKYWEDDFNPNAYKVKLVPTEREKFGNEKLYSSDLKSMLVYGTVKIVK